MTETTSSPKANDGLVFSLKRWGENSLNPMLLATLATPQHLRPVRFPGILFTPALVLDSYASLRGYKKDAAGLLAAQSGLYLLLAGRRKRKVSSGVVRTVLGRLGKSLSGGGGKGGTGGGSGGGSGSLAWKEAGLFSVRGALKGTTLVFCAVNVVAGGLAYTFGDREQERRMRGEAG